jgi:hypothetical protein
MRTRIDDRWAITRRHLSLLRSGSCRRLIWRIDEVSKWVPIDRLALSPQCGFASNAEGNQITVEEEKAKLQLILEIAREVWG